MQLEQIGMILKRPFEESFEHLMLKYKAWFDRFGCIWLGNWYILVKDIVVFSLLEFVKIL